MARQQMDFKVDDNGDRYINPVTGDFAIVESTGQHQKNLIIIDKGEILDNPTVGVGAWGYIDNDELDQLPGAIATEFAKDGMDVVKINMDDEGNVESDAFYK
jgi:hypothetical protein